MDWYHCISTSQRYGRTALPNIYYLLIVLNLAFKYVHVLEYTTVVVEGAMECTAV
jgi:hypothetical protein